MNEELLTVKEVSQILKCGIPYTYKLINEGLLPCMRLGHTKVRRSSVDLFITKYEGKDLTDLKNIKEL